MKRETDTHVIEYDPKLAIIRITILVLIMFFSFYSISKLIGNEDGPIEFESIFKLDEKNITEKFIPLIDNVTIIANIKIEKININEYIIIENINISSNSELEFYIASNWVGSQRILLDNYNPLINYYEFKMHKKLNYDIHNYIIIWDKNENIPIAYAKIK